MRGFKKAFPYERIGILQLDTHLDVRDPKELGPANGTPIRQLVRSEHFTETYSANGRSLTTKSTASTLITLDPTTGELLITGRGNQRHLIVPGLGPVLAQAGHFLLDGEGNLIDVSGLNIPAGSEFCASLSA